MTDEMQGSVNGVTFNCEDHQAIFGEPLSAVNMPAIYFDGARLSVNTASLRKMSDIRYVQFLINPSERKLILRSCGADEKGSFLWCSVKGSKPTPRKIICRLFAAKLAELMGWSIDKKYRIMGTAIKTNSESLMFFDLNTAEIFCRTVKKGETGSTVRNTCFPKEMSGHFGAAVKKPEASITVDVFDDYTVFRLTR